MNSDDRTTITTTCSDHQENSHTKRTRRKRRPTKKQKEQLSESCDVSTTSTASTTPLSDASLSDITDSICRMDLIGQPKKKNAPRRRKRSKKSKSSRINKVVNIQDADLTDNEKARRIALDCEMVGIGPGGCLSRLARVCVVDWDGDVLYDTCVQVVETVTDYRTFVSGITAEDLCSEHAVSYDEARAAVATLLRGKVLVGHGLKNDLGVLALSHPWQDVRDTARYEPFMRPVDPSSVCNPLWATHVPKKLKVLALDKLGMVIQEEGRPHSPEDDAVAALELYKKHRGKWEKAVEWKVEKTRSISLCGETPVSLW